MIPLRVNYKIENLEIISKIMDSVAKKWDCHVSYIPTQNKLEFSGDSALKNYIAEEILALFPATDGIEP